MKITPRVKRYTAGIAILFMVAVHWMPNIIPEALMTPTVMNINVALLALSAYWVLNRETE